MKKKEMFFQASTPAKLRDIKKKYPNLPDSVIERVIAEFGIRRLAIDERMIDAASFHAALNLIEIKQTWKRHGENWYDKFCKSDTLYEWHGLLKNWDAENFERDEYFPLNPSTAVLEQLRRIGEGESPLESVHQSKIKNPKMFLANLPKGIVKGATIRVYCMDCRKPIDDRKACNHPSDRKKYCARFYPPGGGTPLPRMIETQYADEALDIVRKMSEALKESGYSTTDKSVTVSTENKRPVYVADAISQYIRYKENDNDKIVVAKPNSDDYVKSIRTAMRLLHELIETMGFRHFPIEYFNRTDLMKRLYTNLKELKVTEAQVKAGRARGKKVGDPRYGKVSMNNFLSRWSSLILWLQDKHKFSIDNPFEDREKPDYKKKAKAIRRGQFDQLIAWMESSPELPKHKRGHITSADLGWLRIAFTLEKKFDLRRRDVVELRWTSIGFDTESGLFVLKSVNNKATDLSKGDEPVERVEVIDKEVYELLRPLGFDQKACISEDYILVGEAEQAERIASPGRIKSMSRKYMMAKITNGFTFLSKTLFGESFEMTNKNIRKTKLSDNKIKFGEDAWKESHSAKATLERHYVDDEYVALERATGKSDVYRREKR